MYEYTYNICICIYNFDCAKICINIDITFKGIYYTYINTFFYNCIYMYYPGRFKKVLYLQVDIERYGGKMSFHVHKKS